MGAATPFIVAGTSLIQAKNATEIGKFNQKSPADCLKIFKSNKTVC